jgi:cellulose biosynthesis protein BcsQ
MSSIVTFYSYKGGVGRSMALANIAVLLAERGLNVLAVDWDLEAPGLERYFADFEIAPGGPGLLRMCMEARDGRAADYTRFTSTVSGKTRPITLLASGREHDDAAYSRNLEAFDWEAFFTAGGGDFIEALRQRWRDDFDIVLVDSRTGLSDTGGICTIQLPDIVVAMFTANYQSLYGVRDVMRLAHEARQALAYDRTSLTVLPLPARWGVHEFRETQVWLDRVTEAIKERSALAATRCGKRVSSSEKRVPRCPATGRPAPTKSNSSAGPIADQGAARRISERNFVPRFPPSSSARCDDGSLQAPSNGRGLPTARSAFP